MTTNAEAPHLQDRIDEFLKEMAAHVPPEVARTLGGGMVRLAFVDPNYTTRLELGAILDAVRQLGRGRH